VHLLFEENALHLPEAVLSPDGADDFFNERDFGFAFRLVVVEVILLEGFESTLVLNVEADGPGKEAVGRRVLGRAGFTFDCSGAFGFGSIDSGLF
jgi:hypothetical protein